MKIPGGCGKRKLGSVCTLLALAILVVILGLAPAWAAGGDAGHGTQSEAGADDGHGEAADHGETASHGEAAGHGEVHSPPWLKTDTAKVLNFAVLAVLLFLVLRKPASQALNGRIKGIADELKDLETRKAEVEQQLAEYNSKLATLDKEAEQVIAEYIRQGEEAKGRILKEAETTAEKLKEQAKKNIEHEFKQAKLQLQTEIVDKALAKAEQAIKDKVTDKDQERLVDDYLGKVVA
jgi:F-type H+-transporting ATPase subunit b